MLTTLAFAHFSSELLLREQMIIPVKKTLNNAGHIEFWLFSRENPAKSADFSANFDFFPAKIPRNQPISPRICPWKSREIWLFCPRNIRSPEYTIMNIFKPMSTKRISLVFWATELDMSTGLDLTIPSSRPLTFPGGQSKNGYRARWPIELGDLSSSVFQEKKKREKMEIKAIITTWSTKSKTPSRSQFVTDKNIVWLVD